MAISSHVGGEGEFCTPVISYFHQQYAHKLYSIKFHVAHKKMHHCECLWIHDPITMTAPK